MNYADCEYIDQKGISYLVHGNNITRIKIADLSNYSGNLLADLKANDHLINVVRKLKSLPSNFPTWTISAGDKSEIYLGTHTCMKGTNGTDWAYLLRFDKNGRLVSISEESSED